MIQIQRRGNQHPIERVLVFLAGLFATFSAFAPMLSAQSLGSRTSLVTFDPTPSALPAIGTSLSTLPHVPLHVVSPLAFNFVPVGNLLAMQTGTPANQALATQVVNGFVAAADRWRTHFSDNITVNIEIDYDAIGNGVLGGNSSNYLANGATYSNVHTRLIADASSADDAIAVANLQTASSIDMVTNNTSANLATPSPRIRDNNGSANNSVLDPSRANAKALGLLAGNDSGIDSNITFTNFNDYAFPLPVPPNIGWDFDPSDGIAANRIDFVGVATHEIGHAMGFESGVDIVDLVGSPNGPLRLPANGGPYDLDGFRLFSVLDLYRFSANSITQSGQPVPGGVKDLAFGQFNASSRPYFSINSGATNLATFSTGSYNGDGNQASHWQDDAGIGIMDPTFSLGELGAISLVDRRAMDVIGWNPSLVPEPATFVLFAAAIVGLSISQCGRRIRRASLLR